MGGVCSDGKALPHDLMAGPPAEAGAALLPRPVAGVSSQVSIGSRKQFSPVPMLVEQTQFETVHRVQQGTPVQSVLGSAQKQLLYPQTPPAPFVAGCVPIPPTVITCPAPPPPPPPVQLPHVAIRDIYGNSQRGVYPIS